jgi:hypothetical protein
LGRASQAAARQATALLAVLDEAARPRVTAGAFDEIFVAGKPVLMGVEPASLCWVLGRSADNREAKTWAGELDKFPALEQAVTDAGLGLVKGLRASDASRLRPVEHSLDVFHTLYQGGRAWRMTEARLWKIAEHAEQARFRAKQARRAGRSLLSLGPAAHQARLKAERILEEAVEIETAWRHLRQCLEPFTPDGRLNTAAAARAELTKWLPALKGPAWAKTVRVLGRPESLTFLVRLQRKLRELPCREDLKQDAIRFEGLRRRPSLREGEDPAARAARGWWLVTTVRHHRDEEFQQAVLSVRSLVRHCWRASSLVEGINSVVRMQQARHRKLTPGLIDLKRFYWNCRRFRTGRRRKHSPYELLGINLPPGSWWDLLKRPPDQLRQHLSPQTLAA